MCFLALEVAYVTINEVCRFGYEGVWFSRMNCRLLSYLVPIEQSVTGPGVKQGEMRILFSLPMVYSD
jgi:hypothetical protein